MKPLALVSLLLCGGCSLYFGSSGDPAGDKPSGQPSSDPPVDPGLPAPSGSDSPPGTEPSPEHCAGPEVHVFGVYVASIDNGCESGPVGTGRVTIERPGIHTLALSAYEATRWHISLAPGARVNAVYLFGYHAQTVDLMGVPVVTQTYDGGGQPACGYSYPYNGQGCDTNNLLTRVEAAAGPIRSFHGCYHAGTWTLHGDMSASSDCDTAAGYQQYDLVNGCPH